MKKILVLILSLSVLLTACSSHRSGNVEIAKKYLEKLGYEVVSFEDEDSIKFTRSQLVEFPSEQIWGVQTNATDEYLDKKIDTVSFFVKKHPLDDKYGMGKTKVILYLQDQKVIGGWSLPESKDPIVGGVYSLDGKTIEEIHGDFEKWKTEWEHNYK